ncbi:hypothetical protein [Streptomyces sp. NPDC056160]|uniref:hypothetical protein n=1 Tax=Streptomyces sp. NPDC056160 TaxID=3345731 RepID=UPI0035D6E21F
MSQVIDQVSDFDNAWGGMVCACAGSYFSGILWELYSFVSRRQARVWLLAGAGVTVEPDVQRCFKFGMSHIPLGNPVSEEPLAVLLLQPPVRPQQSVHIFRKVFPPCVSQFMDQVSDFYVAWGWMVYACTSLDSSEVVSA